MPGSSLLSRIIVSTRSRLTTRSYWQLHYAGGRVVNEWDCDWSLAPYDGRLSVRLYCPNGEVAVLGNTEDATGRLFQFKVAELVGSERGVLAHVVGIVEGSGGECRYAAWEYEQSKLVTGIDNVSAMQYQNVGRLNFGVLGISRREAL